MTWWTLTRKRIVPSYDHALITCRTSSLDHLYMAWAYHEPRRHPIIRFIRGRPRVCGYRYVWDTPFIAEQAAPGDTEHHQIQITGLQLGSQIWFYLFAPDGPYGLEIQGPLQTFVLPPGPPPPQPTPVPVPFMVSDPRIRTGNRYTFWANSTWYAYVPTPYYLQMWKLIDDTMVRQDQANEPTPPAGWVPDSDSRMRDDHTAIHCSYICRIESPGPHLLRHTIFDLTTDTWALDEQICTPAYTIFAELSTCLSLDTNNRPHVIYTDHTDGYPEIHYRNKTTAVWSDPEIALAISRRPMLSPSLTTERQTNVTQVLAVSNRSIHYYSARPPDTGEWSPPQSVLTALNLPDHSIGSGQEFGHIAQVGTDWRVNHYDVTEGFEGTQDLTLPESRYANMIVPWETTPGVAIVYRDYLHNAAYIWKPEGAPWSAEYGVTLTPVGILTAHYAHPDVISCLYTKTPPLNLALFAFYAPWH